MLNKNLLGKFLPVLSLIGLSAVAMTVYADPLDSDHFQSGTWKGLYTTYSYCDKEYNGDAYLTVPAKPQYTSPNSGGISSANFGGTLILTPTDGHGPVPIAIYSDAFKASGVGVTGLIIGPMGGGYAAYLNQTTNNGVYNDTYGYNPNNQNIRVTGATSSGGCRIYIDLNRS